MLKKYPVTTTLDGSESLPCLCGSTDASPVLQSRDYINWLPGNFGIVQCANCSLLRTHPRPAPEELGTYYPDNYGPYASAKVRGPLRRTIRKFIPPSRDSEIPPFGKPGRALELGCSHGSYLDELVSQGWSVTGVEFSENVAKGARERGHDVRVGPAELMSFEPASFDLIVGWMVVEHMSDPVLVLRNAARWAAPGARLAISIPNVDSASFRRFGKHWLALHLPNHLYHFSPKTISATLAQAGWRVDAIHHQVTVRTTIESARIALWPKPLPRKVERGWSLASNVLTLAGLPFAVRQARKGTADRMTVWATVATSSVWS
jgi:SAM-dependent methyltransferase